MFFGVLSAIAAAFIIRLLFIDVVRIEGASMEPSIPRGSVLLVNRAAYGILLPFRNTYIFRFHPPAANDVVLYEDPSDGLFKIKRCAESDGSTVFLIGDNIEASLDSRIYGSLPVEKVLGKVLISIKR